MCIPPSIVELIAKVMYKAKDGGGIFAFLSYKKQVFCNSLLTTKVSDSWLEFCPPQSTENLKFLRFPADKQTRVNQGQSKPPKFFTIPKILWSLNMKNKMINHASHAHNRLQPLFYPQPVQKY